MEDKNHALRESIEKGQVEVARYLFSTRKAQYAARAIKSLKSIKTGDELDWIAGSPKFLKEEGCFITYEEGKSVDAWLADPSNIENKVKFLAKLNQRFRKEPTEEQLGDVSLEAFKELKFKLYGKK
ncbi:MULTISPECIES: hypothetical protein [Burkholderia cepacia complex]|uniref:hypothetical protein n=1 Tax=Burkholderia cepacia complex TaxID=87882 RepID=UPI00114CE5CA|nr:MULTISPECIES: hypothetical protein [Burkholderia cepacia complex]